MKTIQATILVLLISLQFISCSDNSSQKESTEGWSKADKTNFTKICKKNFSNIFDKIKSKEICDCALEKLMVEYSSYKLAESNEEADKVKDLIISCVPEMADSYEPLTWTEESKSEFKVECMEEFNEDFAGITDEICECVLNSLMQKFSSFKEFEDEASIDEVEQLIENCSQENN